MGKLERPSLGRSKAEKRLEQFDTPPIALAPLFNHEPLMAGVKAICEPFCGLGNLVTAMRSRGITVHASDIQDRGCPDSSVRDFLKMTQRPEGCDVLLSNPPFSIAMQIIEHAWALGFRLVVLLLEPSFLHSADRFERLHPRGHLRGIYPLAERLKDMHDAAHIAKGGKKSSQPRMHSWYVFDRNYCGDATTIPVSINNPAARMPWQTGACCQQCRQPYRRHRSDSRFCSANCRQRARRERLSRDIAVTPAPAELFRYVPHADVARFTAEGWERLPALDGTHHGEYSVLMRRGPV